MSLKAAISTISEQNFFNEKDMKMLLKQVLQFARDVLRDIIDQEKDVTVNYYYPTSLSYQFDK